MSEPAVQNIVVVERDRHVRELLVEFLEPAGYALRLFEDGAAALAAVQAHAPALVILEILVPKLDGLGLCRAIKLAPATSDIPVLVLSVLSANDRAHLAGADAFMMKPIEETRLLAAVQRLIVRPAQQEVRP
ncbi:MAG: response regulator [Nannocystis sp.]|nr:response regulator [Nannocystis sp.]MBA3545651.1 response regulator [Nannocystis sp.]